MSPSLEQREHREFAAEVKFLVTPAVAARIRAWARVSLAPDPHAADEAGDGYRITSLYFDTATFDVFHRRGSFGRSKYRVRRYGAGDAAFLERKLKVRGLLAKRRSVVGLPEVPRLNGGPLDPGWAGYWFHRRLRLRRLQAVCRITYRRTARVAMGPFGPVRLTLDDDVRAAAADGWAFGPPGEGVRLVEDHVILELKYRVATPALFKRLVEEFALAPRPLSKYRLAAAALGLAGSEPALAGPPAKENALCLSC